MVRWWEDVYDRSDGSNALGLACGKEGSLYRLKSNRSLITNGHKSAEKADSVAELGVHEACRRTGIDHFQELITMAHSSLMKTASIMGSERAVVTDWVQV